ncbi:sugar phosphate isomerase/epimerase [Nocardia sp. BMG111209]|uniref:sugar phosphate isomerase/epimerase family protein n=1 Tax=Nocardia sp. BMG111209 TaxID=1160137 RepID=UPI0003A25AC2|nr:sugar phosphate isomerase/epimerase family protein [Nocardia sp. BMG111209]
MEKALDDIGWVLWHGTLGLQSAIADRIAAATAAGFGRVSVSPFDVATAAQAGTTPADLGRRLRDAGLEVVLDGLMNWYPGRPLTSSPTAAFTAPEVLDMCAALRPAALTVLARPTCEISPDEVAAAFGDLCDRAQESDTRVQLEFMPMMAIGDLAAAWTVVGAADRANGGLLFDTWHFYRGNPDFGTLANLPGDRIFGVQVADSTVPEGSLIEDTFRRAVPGDGRFDLEGVLRALDRIGGLRWIGPEVISPVTAAMPPVEAAHLTATRIRTLLGTIRADGTP